MEFLRSAPGDEPVVVETTFGAPVARVYRAWTEPEEIKQWFGLKAGSVHSAEIDLRVGGHWCFVMQQEADRRASLQGEYLRIEPDTCLEFTWRHVVEHKDGRREATPDSKVIVSFRMDGESNHVHLRHEGIRRVDARSGVGQGWNASFAQLGDWLDAAMQGDRR